MANSEHILNIVAKLNTSEIKQQLNQLNKSRSANSVSGTATANQQQTKGLDASFSNRLNTSLNTLNSTLNRLNNSLNRLNIGQNTQRFSQQNSNPTNFGGSSAFLASSISTGVLSRNINKQSSATNKVLEDSLEKQNKVFADSLKKQQETLTRKEAEFTKSATRFEADNVLWNFKFKLKTDAKNIQDFQKKANENYQPAILRSYFKLIPEDMRGWTRSLMPYANYDQLQILKKAPSIHPDNLTDEQLNSMSSLATKFAYKRIYEPAQQNLQQQKQSLENIVNTAEKQVEILKRQNLAKRQQIANKEAQTEQKRSTNLQRAATSSGGSNFSGRAAMGALGALVLSEGVQSAVAILGERANYFKAAGDNEEYYKNLKYQTITSSAGGWASAGAGIGYTIAGPLGAGIGAIAGGSIGYGLGKIEADYKLAAEMLSQFAQTLQTAAQIVQNFENKIKAVEFEKEVKELFSEIDTAVLNANKGEFNLTALNAAKKQHINIKKSAEEDMQIQQIIMDDQKKVLKEYENQRKYYVKTYRNDPDKVQPIIQELDKKAKKTTEILQTAQNNYDQSLIKFKHAENREKALTQSFTLYDKTTESMKSQYSDTFITADAKRESSKFIQTIIKHKDLEAIDELYSKTQDDLFENKDTYQDLLRKLRKIQNSPKKSVEEYNKIFNQTRKVQQEIIEGESISETLFNAKKQIRLTELNDNLTKQQERLANLVAPDLTNVQSLANIGANMGEKNDNVERQLNFWRNSLTLQEEIKEILNQIKETENLAQYA